MATQNKPEWGWFKNPQFNKSGQLTHFDGMKMIKSFQKDKDGNEIEVLKADRSDPETVKLIDKVKNLPRTSDSGDGGSSDPHVVIDGKTYRLANKFFTDDEAAAYKAYRDVHGKGGSGTSKKGSEADEKTFDRLTELITKYKDKKEYAPVIEDIKNLRNMYIDTIGSEKKDQMLKELLGL